MKKKIKKRRHHYIPRSFIKNFCFDSNSIWLYNYSSNSVVSEPVHKKDLFVKKDLYKFIDKFKEPQSNLIEDFYDKELERSCLKSINSILHNFNKNVAEKDILPKDYYHLSEFAIYTYTRNYYELTNYTYDKRLITNGYIILQNYLETKKIDISYRANFNRGNILFEALDNAHNILGEILDLKLTFIGHKIENQYFLLSDQPIIINPASPPKFLANDLQIIFPISSNLIVKLERRLGKYEIGYKELKCQEEIEEYNLKVSKNFYKQIACESDEYLKSFVKRNFVKLLPLGIIDKKLFEIEIMKLKEKIVKKVDFSKNWNYSITYLNKELDVIIDR